MLFNYQEFLDGIDRKAYHEGEWQWEEDGYTVCITLQSGARHTLAVLQACGLDGTLVTQAQIQKEDAVYAQSTTGRG